MMESYQARDAEMFEGKENKMPRVINLTGLQTDPPKKYKKFRRQGIKGGVLRTKKPGGTVVCRNMSQVVGITIHQTACNYKGGKRLVKKVGKDKARHMRALGTPYHVMVFKDGCVVHANPLVWYTYGGNNLNSFTLNFAIEGRYPGLWRPGKDKLTPKTYRAACQALRYLVREGCKLGMPIQYIYAHRQSNKKRRADPGAEIWNKVIINYAVKKLGLRTAPRFTIGSGRPIPVEWDIAGYERY